MSLSSTSIKKGEIRNPKGRGKGVKDNFGNIIDACVRLGHNPIEALIKIAMHGETEENRMKANFKLVERLVPILKSVEHKGNQESPVKFIINLPRTDDQ